MGNEVDMAEVLVSWLHSQGTVVLTFAWSLLVAAIVSYLIIAGKCNCYRVWIWKSPESAVFRKHYYTLQVAIQSPETLANKLFSRRVIDTCVKEKVHLPTLTTHEKCQILLNAVERQIKYRHERFYKFVHTLQDEPTTEDLSRQLIEDAARIGRYNWIKPAMKKACRIEGVLVVTTALLVMDVYLLQLNLAPCIILGGVLLLSMSIMWQYRNENDYECEEPEYPPIFSLPEQLVVQVSNYQTLQRIVAVNRIVVDCPDQELQKDEQFSPILSVLDAMTNLPINCMLLLKGEKAPEQKGYQMLLCYISVEVVIHPFDQHCYFCDPKALYHMQRSTSGHIHTNKLALRFCFFRADANYIIKFSVHCITDTEEVQYMHNTKVCECVLRVVERGQNILGVQHGETLVKDLPMVRFSGSLAGSRFQALEKLFVNSILACDSRKVEEMTRDILTAKCIGADWKAVALSYQGMAKLLVHGQLDSAEIKLTEALNEASGLKCPNSVLLQGRFLRQKATVMRKQGKFGKAMEYIRGAKERLFNAAPSYDRSAVLYEEILLKVVCGYNETVALNRQEIESIYDLVLMHASAFKDYEYQSLCMVLTAKAEFHLRSIYVRENLPAENLKPTPEDIHKAEICLKRIIPELLPGEAHVYRAHYYLVHSDLCLWKEKYTEAITWAKKAEDQFKLGKVTSTNAMRPQNRLKLLKKLQTWKKEEEKEVDDILKKYSLTVS